jgi:hypothetical protein
MRSLRAVGVITSSALVALTLSGCVTEEIGPTNFDTTAYIERDASSDAAPGTTRRHLRARTIRIRRAYNRTIDWSYSHRYKYTSMTRNLLLGLLLSLALTGAHAGCVEEQA